MSTGRAMHSQTVEHLRHAHAFLGQAHARNERRTIWVVALTAAMMVGEIAGGSIFGSMALTADGWHMSTHVVALGIAALAYRFARARQNDPRFTFGTGKLGELAGFASAIILAMIALFIGYESVTRLAAPVPIAFAEAIPIAALGLVVNLASALLLHAGHGHDHGDHHGHGHHHDHGHHHSHAHEEHAHAIHDHHGAVHGDTNFRAAYVHVLADALTSVLAVAALTAGRFLGWTWLDPAMGLVGTVVIVAWSLSLLRSAGASLLDMVPGGSLADDIRRAIEIDGDRIADLHLWRLGPGHNAVILSVVTDVPRPPSAYKGRLSGIATLSHITVEVHRCAQGHAKAA